MAKIEALTNLEQVASDIGRYLGMAEGVQQREYMEGLLDTAYGRAVRQFHKDAAKAAKAQNFSHMYEYGTAGVNDRGRLTNLNPTAKKARLWVDQFLGGGGRRSIGFVFRDATVANPPHTTAETGVAQEELDQLAVNKGKKYYFKKRAEVFERGISVNIYPNEAKALFVPLAPSGLAGSTRDKARGFTFAKSLRYAPGQAGGEGTFTNFFWTWWSTIGAEKMASEMSNEVTRHIREEEKKMGANASLKPAMATRVNAVAEAQQKKTRKQFEIKAMQDADWESKIL